MAIYQEDNIWHKVTRKINRKEVILQVVNQTKSRALPLFLMRK